VHRGLTADAVTTLGSGVDGAVRRVEIEYDGQGNAYLLTTYDAASGGNIVNQIQRDSCFGEPYSVRSRIFDAQRRRNPAAHAARLARNNEMASSANHSRLTKITYPNGKELNFNYGSGLNDNMSRLSSLSDSTGTLESYDYLGLGVVVKRGHTQPGVDLTYIKQSGESNGDAGDQYIGLDRFGRIADQRWRASSSDKDRFQYGHDRNGNRLYRDNTLNNSFDELYHSNGASNGHDGLNQLTAFLRGALSDTNSDNIPDTISTNSRTQVWDFDALGNFDSQTTDGTGQSRSHNKQNEITSIGSLTTPTYDANGNMTGDENGKTLVYDAWNRLVAYKNGGTTLISYKYDAANRRVSQTASSVTTDFYFSDQWQVLEERISGNAKIQYIWSPVYVDAMILRDRDATGDSALEERLWAMHDANFNVTGLLDNSGNVVERFAYDPYGTPSYFDANWGTADSDYFEGNLS
jgi:YD repeat-containing protein